MSVAATIKENPVVIFGEDYCPFVRRSRQTLEAMGIPFVYVNNLTNKQRSELQSLAGKSTVPQGFCVGVAIGGCDDGRQSWMGICKLAKSGKLKKASTAGSSEEAERILTA
jgi:glutaredoxin-related protein